MGDWLPRDGMSTMPWMWSLVSCSFLFASLREIKVKCRMKDEKLELTATVEAVFEDYRIDTHIPSFPPSH